MSEKCTDRATKEGGLGSILVQHFHSKDEEPRKGERQVDDEFSGRSVHVIVNSVWQLSQEDNTAERGFLRNRCYY